MAPGTKTTLGILRDGKRKDVRVTLGELDPSLLPGASQQPMPRGPQGRADTAANPLGLVGQDLDADDRRQAGLESGEGIGLALIAGMAERVAGLKPGDLVLRRSGWSRLVKKCVSTCRLMWSPIQLQKTITRNLHHN